MNESLLIDKRFPSVSLACPLVLAVNLADRVIVHIPASGNAPELRCYAESATLDKAKDLSQRTLSQVQ